MLGGSWEINWYMLSALFTLAVIITFVWFTELRPQHSKRRSR